MTDTQASTATPAVGRTQTATNPPAAKPETPPPAEDRPPRGKVVRILAIVAVVMGVLFIWKVFFFGGTTVCKSGGSKTRTNCDVQPHFGKGELASEACSHPAEV